MYGNKLAAITDVSVYRN